MKKKKKEIKENISPMHRLENEAKNMNNFIFRGINMNVTLGSAFYLLILLNIIIEIYCT